MSEKQKKFLLWLVLGQLLCIVVIIVWVVGSDFIRDSMGTVPFFGSAILLILFGIVLAILMKKYNVAKPLKIYLAMTAYSAIYFLPATVAHNFLEVGGEWLGGFFGGVLGFLGAVFFITSVIGVPIALFIGISGSLVLLLRKS